MKKYIWISLLFLFSCGSRKVESQKEIIQETKSEQSTTETKGSITSELSEKTLFNLFENNMNFALKPIGDIPAKFVFIHNGQKIEGETSGELNFSSQQKNVHEEIKFTKKTQIIFRIKEVYRIHKVYRTVTKHKESESKRSEVAWYILSAFLGMAFIIAAQVIWKKYVGEIVNKLNKLNKLNK